MIFQAPRLEPADLEVAERIQAVRESLRFTLGVPRQWTGLLRRSTMGRAIRGSNSIEGYRIAEQDVVAAAEGEPVAGDSETMRATVGYRRAMTYMLQLAKDQHFQWSAHVLKSLHYMMLEHELDNDKAPGQWRPGPIFVYDEDKQERVYEGPAFQDVPGLMGELIESLAAPDERVPYLVRAALAHLNLTMIHPFRDGNGRMARCLQTLVLGRNGTLEPQFSSIEEYLGKHQVPYYEVLSAVGKGNWHPEHDAHPFVRFCLRAHFYQAHTLLHRIQQGGIIWDELEEEVRKRSLPERTTLALWDATHGYKVVNATYRAAAEISQPVASRELTALVEAGLLIAEGEKRARTYQAARPLVELRKRVSGAHIIPDPYPIPSRAAVTASAETTKFTAATMAPSSSTGPKPPPSQSPNVTGHDRGSDIPVEN